MDVDHEYFLASFDLDDDREKAINGGPWMIFDHYLTVRPWSPNFSAQDDSINKTLVWVRFLNLNMMFYVESVLLTIASVIGKPLKVDLHTANMLRERFARVCVEVDLNTPVVGKFNLNGKWYNIEYEGLHLLCSNCGCYGHVNWNCSLKTTEEQGPTPAGEATALGNDSVSRNNAKSISCNISATNQDKSVISAHGDWLVVRRKKKSNIQKSSKDFVQNNSNSNKGFTFQSSAGRSTANNPKATPMHATPKSTSSRGIKQTSSRGFIKKIDPTTLMGSTRQTSTQQGSQEKKRHRMDSSPISTGPTLPKQMTSTAGPPLLTQITSTFSSTQVMHDDEVQVMLDGGTMHALTHVEGNRYSMKLDDVDTADERKGIPDSSCNEVHGPDIMVV
ncbi:uncharacterized protein LOC109803727 [Cajanus cajan]|uniref:uncharacterized protein LOC109803727 n=1 Tax=Cajanus cajan TaxID=3821 RepID=UPI00098DB755|nr:uncharacterized protein LOC109803727 [Cajanus cajan]